MNRLFVELLNKYVDLGFYMFPLYSNDKKPAIANWGEESSNNIEELTSIYAEHPELNLAIVTGRKSGLFVIDVDSKNGHKGVDTLVALEEELGELPETMVCETPNGGYHYYFRYPKELHIEKLGNKTNIGDGLDIRSDGGYVVAPPSKLENGHYRVINKGKLAAIPIKWINYIYKTEFTVPNERKTLRNGTSLIIPLRKSFQLPDTIEDGARNDTLIKYAGHLIGKGISLDKAKDEILKMNNERCRTPIPTKELEETIFKSMEKYHAEHEEKMKPKSVRELAEGSEKQDISWLIVSKTGRADIDELKYARYYIKDVMKGNLFFLQGMFYDKNLIDIPTAVIEQDIMREIGEFITSSVMKKVLSIVEILKRETLFDISPRAYDALNIYSSKSDRMLEFNPETKCYVLTDRQRETPVLNAIDVDLNPEILAKRNSYMMKDDAPFFYKWITELLGAKERDILQEFIGYCLVPTTKCQVALQIEGDAGVGKSRVYDVLSTLIGRRKISVADLCTLEEDKYIANMISNKLVIYDDDLKVQSLKDTGMLKTLISANDTSIRVQEKFERAYNLKSYAKILCCGNHLLSSLYDKSEGLWRRFIVIRCNRLNKRRENISFDTFVKAFDEERNYIFLWALDGLERLIKNDWIFSHQDLIKENRQILKEENDPVEKFLNHCKRLVKTDNEKDVVPQQWLYQYFIEWCRFDGILEIRDRSFYKTMITKLGDVPIIKRVNGTPMKCYKGLKWLTDDELYELEIAEQEANIEEF